MPVAIAVFVLAVVATGLWWFNRSAPIPSTPPKTTPAVGSCWDVDPSAVVATLPWPGSPVECANQHTAEVFYTGQVDHTLIKTVHGAKGQDAQIANVLIEAQARTGCTAHVQAYLGGPWRSAQLSVVPDFIAPKSDGFYACSVSQVSDPGGGQIVPRSGTLRGALTGSSAGIGIDCYAAGAGGALSFVPCTQDHTGEYVGLYAVTPFGAPYDGPKLQAAVTNGCQAILNGFLGLPAGATKRPDLRASFVGPTSSVTWVGSDQSFACYATASATMRGSIKGLGTRPLPH
jgi:hypothetical protein